MKLTQKDIEITIPFDLKDTVYFNVGDRRRKGHIFQILTFTKHSSGSTNIHVFVVFSIRAGGEIFKRAFNGISRDQYTPSPPAPPMWILRSQGGTQKNISLKPREIQDFHEKYGVELPNFK